MEMNDKINQFVSRIENLQESVKTEEATKTSLVMPFFQMLGYDVFNPLEFVPEYTADVGIKKGEKVDYAIILDNEPLILIECKPCNENLDKHGSQLFRYFGTSSAKFGILTNGIIYRFYTDLEDKNKMDLKPFLTINMLDLKERDIIEIAKFAKDTLNIDNILNSASDLMYTRLIKEWLSNEISNPSNDFVRLILNNVYDGLKSQRVIDKFTPLVKRSLAQYINDSLNSKIKNALSKENSEDTSISISTPEPTIANITNEEAENKIVTTIEELEAYAIVKSILRPIIDSNRIYYKDTESYFGILLDNNIRKWICRVHLTNKVKYLIISDESKNQIRFNLNSVDDLYNFGDEIKKSCQKYL